jgi:hypothetical protein
MFQLLRTFKAAEPDIVALAPDFWHAKELARADLMNRAPWEPLPDPTSLDHALAGDPQRRALPWTEKETLVFTLLSWLARVVGLALWIKGVLIVARFHVTMEDGTLWMRALLDVGACFGYFVLTLAVVAGVGFICALCDCGVGAAYLLRRAGRESTVSNCLFFTVEAAPRIFGFASLRLARTLSRWRGEILLGMLFPLLALAPALFFRTWATPGRFAGMVGAILVSFVMIASMVKTAADDEEYGRPDRAGNGLWRLATSLVLPGLACGLTPEAALARSIGFARREMRDLQARSLAKAGVAFHWSVTAVILAALMVPFFARPLLRVAEFLRSYVLQAIGHGMDVELTAGLMGGAVEFSALLRFCLIAGLPLLMLEFVLGLPAALDVFALYDGEAGRDGDAPRLPPEISGMGQLICWVLLALCLGLAWTAAVG